MSTVVQTKGFQWKADRPEASGWAGQKWGWQSDRVGDWATLQIDSRAGTGDGNATAEDGLLPNVTISLGHLQSHQGMGTASVKCIQGCRCAASSFDSLWDRMLSIVQTHQFEVTQHSNCQFRVKVEGRSDGKNGTRVKLTSLAVASMPLILGDTQAAEGMQDGKR